MRIVDAIAARSRQTVASSFLPFSIASSMVPTM
jgi:hypothetical protein